MSAPAIPTVDLPKTLGALLIGALFASVLLGITSLQAGFYFRYYGHDPFRLKLMVAVVSIHMAHPLGLPDSKLRKKRNDRERYVVCTGPSGKYSGPETYYREIPTTIIQNLCIGAFKDCFFAYRIFILSKRNWFLTAPVVTLLFLRPALGIAASVELFKLKNYTSLQESSGWLVTLGLSVSAVLDSLTTSELVFLLFQHRVGNAR
ncbi:hypothetical protein FB45DRAFT_1022725 [Roridomyces roridus]|uniref:Uncharacterized protein n=1 Tax=Roridomyces roridus TaxID=1738132 RepID=A0AAD7C8Z5_9AGAR|nr:hypothetical protein FB45DRAFT_1022725 [Roridomyces roridus]